MRLRRRPSIYEHVRAHLTPDGQLAEDGETLPDEELVSGEGGLVWAPGALEGAFSRYGDADEPSPEQVAELHRAVLALADAPGRGSRRRLRAALDETDVRTVVDDLLERVREEPPDDQGRLYVAARSLVLESDRRDEVKLGVALLGLFGDADDVEIFRTLARHEEFTLYAAIALANSTDRDPTEELLDLLPVLSGWGKTELVGLLLRDPSDETRAVLLRDGLAIGNALELAVEGRLAEALEKGDVDDALLLGAGRIIDALVGSSDSPDELTDYPEAGRAVGRFLEELEPRARTLEQLLWAVDLSGYLDTAGAERLDAVGLDASTRERVRGVCNAIVCRPGWDVQIHAALRGDDRSQRGLGILAAKALGMPLHDYLVAELERHPNDSQLWWELVSGADAARMDEAIGLATRLLRLDAVASGPALEYFGPFGEDEPHQAFGFVLQELPRFPGKGGDLLFVALRSPVIRDRGFALRALSLWPDELPDGLRTEVARRARDDPYDEWREAAAAVLRGEPMPEPPDEADPFESDDS